MFEIIAELLKTVAPIINKFIPDPQAQAQINLELQKALLDSNSEIYKSMASVMAADAASESWMTRNLRPFAGFWSIGVISLIVVTSPFGWSHYFIDACKQIPSDLWNLTTVCLGGYILARGLQGAAASFNGKK